MSYITISNINKSYFKKVNEETKRIDVLKDINFEVDKGEFITFFGPNGCGKTTFLKVIANLENPDSGHIKLEGKESENFNIGFVFQDYSASLYPWRTNLRNIVFPLQLDGISKIKRLDAGQKLIQELGINIDLDSYPYQLSGGQKQLVAIARGLANNPDFLLMDEPFSSLDYQTRFEMQLKILDIWRRTNKTILFVSHEIDEAIFLADKVVVFSKRPARVLDIIETKLPRPRSHSIIKSNEYIQIKTKILDLFFKEISK